MGLFIVKDTVERLKGTIEVDSVSGKGTTFTIYIPNQFIHQPIEVE
jgi:signal transduction histidine kinase